MEAKNSRRSRAHWQIGDGRPASREPSCDRVWPARVARAVCARHREPAGPRRDRAGRPGMCHAPAAAANKGDTAMAKGLDKQKEQKKKPAKTAKEKKAEKNEKKSTRGFAPT